MLPIWEADTRPSPPSLSHCKLSAADSQLLSLEFKPWGGNSHIPRARTHFFTFYFLFQICALFGVLFHCQKVGGVRKFTNMIHADIAQRIHTAINQSLLAHIHEKSGVSRDNISANFLDVIDFSAKFRDFIRIFEKTISAAKVPFSCMLAHIATSWSFSDRLPSKLMFVTFCT